jgi:hypothetical protein
MPPTTEQDALVVSLASRSAKLARIYQSGLLVFYDEKNPGRLQLTAHCMRELIEKIPLLTEGEALSTGDSMKARLHPVRNAYFTVTRGLKFDASVDASDATVQTLFVELEKFFEWETANRPQARRRTAETLAKLSGPGQMLPVDISEDEVGAWMEADGYFKRVAHNQLDNIQEDHFLRHMTFVENVLLRRLQPTAVEDLDILDALIVEGEDGH